MIDSTAERVQQFLSVTCQSNHAERARARRVGVADLTVIGRPSKNVGLQSARCPRQMSPTFLWCRQQTSATYVGKYEQAVSLRNGGMPADGNVNSLYSRRQCAGRLLTSRWPLHRRSLLTRNDTLLNALFITDRITPRRPPSPDVFIRVHSWLNPAPERAHTHTQTTL